MYDISFQESPINNTSMSAITSSSFQRLVQSLKRHQKTITVVEQCCGGLIQTSIMAQPGASKVYVGGSIPYNTRVGKKLLLNDETLHQSLTAPTDDQNGKVVFDKSTSKGYIQSKYDWTSKTSLAFCQSLNTDYAIAEGGAAGPPFNPKDMSTGFTVLSVAGYDTDTDTNTKKNDSTKAVPVVLTQKLVQSSTNDREGNMRLFADAAADLLTEVIERDNHTTDNTTIPTEKETKKSGETVTENVTEKTPITLERCTELRSDSRALQDLEPTANYIIVRGNDILMDDHSSSSSSNHDNFNVNGDNDSESIELGMGLVFLSYNEMIDHVVQFDRTTKTFLGRLTDTNHTPIFAIDTHYNNNNNNNNNKSGKELDTKQSNNKNNTSTISNNDDDAWDVFHSGNTHGYRNVRTTAPLLPSQLHHELALQAMAYGNWQRKNNYCPLCGAPVMLIDGGTCQQCTSCSTKYWPRQDPSMIVSISSRCGNKILLARSHRHPPRMHTVLAGFVEVGETFEAAVARETYEEVGVRVDTESIRYIGSQPWPFPQSCMIAFTATADAEVYTDAALTIDKKELLDAKWFTRDEVVAAATGGSSSSANKNSTNDGGVMSHEQAKVALEANPNLSLLIPPKRVIARTLIDEWLSQ